LKEREILQFLKEQRKENHRFVKWWRKENDFSDYDLIERFVDHFSPEEDLAGIELLTMAEMWGEIQRIAGSRVKLVPGISGESVEWVHHGKTGTKSQVCGYTPETLMTIFDVETKGNPID
jgi:hypothetical protein